VKDLGAYIPERKSRVHMAARPPLHNRGKDTSRTRSNFGERDVLVVPAVAWNHTADSIGRHAGFRSTTKEPRPNVAVKFLAGIA